VLKGDLEQIATWYDCNPCTVLTLLKNKFRKFQMKKFIARKLKYSISGIIKGNIVFKQSLPSDAKG
jgi:hypothetical protein